MKEEDVTVGSESSQGVKKERRQDKNCLDISPVLSNKTN